MAYHSRRFPGESEEYRQARNDLLTDEIALRRRIEDIAEKRRHLPLGGTLPTDYALHGINPITPVPFSTLFEPGKDILILYTLMFGPDAEKACPMCTAFLDGLNGDADHVRQKFNLAIVAKSSAEKLSPYVATQAWQSLPLYSTYGTDFNTDYHSESEEGNQWPILHIFKKVSGDIFHCYTTELFYSETDWPYDPRHVDMMTGLWNMMDLTPNGRDPNWYPTLLRR